MAWSNTYPWSMKGEAYDFNGGHISTLADHDKATSLANSTEVIARSFEEYRDLTIPTGDEIPIHGTNLAFFQMENGRKGIRQSTQRPGSQSSMLSGIAPILREHLNEVGRLNGKYGTCKGRNEEYQFWREVAGASNDIASDSAAASWLITQMDEITDQRTLSGISNILTAIAPLSVGPILLALEQGRMSSEKAATLLSALTGIDPNYIKTRHSLAAHLLSSYLCHSDDAVRMMAASATVVLDAETRLKMLQHALTFESDAYLQKNLNEELELSRPV